MKGDLPASLTDSRRENMFDTAKKNEKITDVIISQVRDAILSGQLKPGDRLASEKELVIQFGVSKATLRESLRALEVMGLVELRKGASGGVFITEVKLQTIIHSMMNFLHFKSLSISEITMIRFMLEPAIVRIAAANISDKDIKSLESFIASGEADNDSRTLRDISFHRYLSRVTSNSMLILIVDFIESLLDEIKQSVELGADFYTMVQGAHQRILDCLVQGDSEEASKAMAEDVLMVGKYLSERMGEKAFDPSDYALDNSLPFPAVHGSAIDSALKRGAADHLEAVELMPHELANAKVLKKTGSADIYLIVPHDSEEESA